MPDLDLIKQGEQGWETGAGGSPGAGRATPPAGRAAAATTSTAVQHGGSDRHRRTFRIPQRVSLFCRGEFTQRATGSAMTGR